MPVMNFGLVRTCYTEEQDEKEGKDVQGSIVNSFGT